MTHKLWENICSQQCILLYILDLYISYMLLKFQLTVQYKIKNILYVCVCVCVCVCAAVVPRHKI
jgi:hypothetical protein